MNDPIICPYCETRFDPDAVTDPALREAIYEEDHGTRVTCQNACCERVFVVHAVVFYRFTTLCIEGGHSYGDDWTTVPARPPCTPAVRFRCCVRCNEPQTERLPNYPT